MSTELKCYSCSLRGTLYNLSKGAKSNTKNRVNGSNPGPAATAWAEMPIKCNIQACISNAFRIQYGKLSNQHATFHRCFNQRLIDLEPDMNRPLDRTTPRFEPDPYV